MFVEWIEMNVKVAHGYIPLVLITGNMTAAAEELVSVAENFHENQVKTVNKQK